MKQDMKSFLHESLQDADTLVDILKSIADGIEKGKISCSDEDNEIVLKPEGLMQLKVSAAQDNNHYRFNLKVNWQSKEAIKKKRLKVKKS